VKKYMTIARLRSPRLGFAQWWMPMFLLTSLTWVQSQELVRDSLAGVRTAESRSKADQLGGYNLKLGNLLLDLDATVGTEYNDNINLADRHGRLSDVSVRGMLGIRGVWQVTKLNNLTMDVGLGYEKYLFHPEADTKTLLIAPNSQFNFDVFAGDFRINFHDRFSSQQDPVEVGNLSGLTRFSRFQNAVGVTVDWDLNDLILTAGLDHYNYWSFDKEFQYLNHRSEVLFGRAAFTCNPTTKAGLEGSFTMTAYDENFQNGSNGFRGGAFTESRLSESLAIEAHAGVESVAYERGGRNGDSEDLMTYYATLGVTHRPNRFISQSITGGKDNVIGLASNYTERLFVRHTASWEFIRDWAVGTEFFFENLDDSDSRFH
jgi:hypothetical protein